MYHRLLIVAGLSAACRNAGAQPQPPKCAPRSTDTSCDNFAGSWTGMYPSNPLFDEYALNTTAVPGAFTCTMVQTPAKNPWVNCSGQLSPDNTTVTITFNTGVTHSGTVGQSCQSLTWSDGSTWQRFVRSPNQLNIHFALHTHDDVGWNKNLQDYFDGSGAYEYGQNVTAILDSVVQALLLDPRRRFSYVEQKYFTMWWALQPPAVQTQVQSLVASRQLVFLNGGWSMHDEAAPTYVDMLDNTALGHRAILEAFGAAALPNLTWQIDPFGHSGFQGVLSGGSAGFAGVMWAREAQEFKAASCASETLERVWLPSRTLGGAAASFQGVFTSLYYTSPSEVERCDNEYGPTPTTCNATWAASDALLLSVDIDAYYAPSIASNEILLLMGDDFTFENGLAYFNYTDALIAALNNHPSGRYHAFYSTPSDYVGARLAELSPSNALTALFGDMMPYNDDAAGHNVWSGYFTSRPSFKGAVREASAWLQGSRQLQAAVGGVNNSGPTNPLFSLEQALGIAQHHDAIAGTAQQFVNDDYLLRLEAGRSGAYASVADSLVALTGYEAAFAVCPLTNVSICPALEAGSGTLAVVHNSLGQHATGTARVRLAAGFPAGVSSYAVFDATGAPVVAQIVPLSPRDAALRTLNGGNSSAVVQWLCFVAPSLPPAGFSVFFIIPQGSTVNAPSTFASVVTTSALGNDSLAVSNERLTVSIDSTTGWMGGYYDRVTGVNFALSQSWLSYIGANGSSFNGSSQASGAYIFRPMAEAPETLLPNGAPANVTLVTGPVVNETQHEYAYVTQETRLWAGAVSVEIEWTVGPVDVSDFNSHEVVTRYSAGTAFVTDGSWASDANCREMQPRRRNSRLNWDVSLSEPVSGNYFPAACLLRTSSLDGIDLVVALDRAQGSTSLVDGQLELMVHRRLLYNDGRGASVLNEPGIDGKGLIVRGRHWLLAAPHTLAPPLYKALQHEALALPTTVRAFAPLGAVSPAEWLARYTGTASALASAASLPANVHLATLQALNATTLLLRLAHTYEAGEDPVGSTPATVSVAALLRAPVASVTDLTLPASQPLADVPARTYFVDDGSAFTVPEVPPAPTGPSFDVTLSPMQIRTLRVVLAAPVAGVGAAAALEGGYAGDASVGRGPSRAA